MEDDLDLIKLCDFKSNDSFAIYRDDKWIMYLADLGEGMAGGLVNPKDRTSELIDEILTLHGVTPYEE